MAHGMCRMAFQPRPHQHQGGNALQHLQHIKGGAVLKLVAADHDVHAALAHAAAPPARWWPHPPASPARGRPGRHHHLRVAGVVVNEKDADRHGDARLPAQLQEPYPAACRSRYRRGQGQGPGYKYVGFIAVLCVRGRLNQSGPLAIVQRSRPRRTQFGTISGLALFYCAVCAGQRRLGTRVFRAPQGLFPRGGFAPLGCFLPQCACFRRAASCHAVVQRQPIPSSTHPHRARLARARCAVPNITPCCGTPRCSAC